MPDFLHEIVKKRETQQEYHGWQQSIEHAIGQQDITDPWDAVIARNSDVVHPRNEDLGGF
jgi:hypothetical protein